MASVTDQVRNGCGDFETTGRVGTALRSAPAARERWVRRSGLRDGRPFPPATLLLSDGVQAEDDLWNHHRLFGEGVTGSSLGRQVPWEREQTPTRYLADAPHLVPVFIPKLVFVLAQAEATKGRPLTRREVLSIRDDAYCAMVPPSSPLAREPASQGDIDPARCWEAWQEHRKARR